MSRAASKRQFRFAPRPGWVLGFVTYFLISVAILLVAGLGFGGIPQSSSVVVGDQMQPRTADALRVSLSGPTQNIAPDKLVSDFMWANAMNAPENVVVSYLSAATAGSWVPVQEAMLYSAAAPPEVVFDGNATVTVTVSPVGRISRTGEYTPVGNQAQLAITVKVVKSAQGQWRVESFTGAAPALISAPTFFATHERHNVVLLSRAQNHPVTIARWMPGQTGVDSLLNQLFRAPTGRYPNLFSALEGSVLAAPLEIEGTTISLSLRTPSTVDEVQRRLIVQQLQGTLSPQLPGYSLRVTINGEAQSVRLGADISNQPTLSGWNPLASVMASSDTGELIQLLDSGAQHKQITIPIFADHAVKSYATGMSGRAVAATTDSDNTLLAWNATAGGQTFSYESPVPLLKPSIDDFGWYWAVGADQSGNVVALHSADQTTGAKYTKVTVKAEGLRQRTLKSVGVSPDGMSVFVLFGETAAQQVMVGSVIRNAAGTPLEISALRSVAPRITNIAEVSWAGPASLAVVGTPPALAPDISGNVLQTGSTATPVAGGEGRLIIVPIDGPEFVVPGLYDIASVCVNEANRQAYAVTKSGATLFFDGRRWATLPHSFQAPAFSF